MGTTFIQGVKGVKAVAQKAAAVVGLGSHSLCINKLTLNKVASFEEAVDIPLKKFNFIYGLNGTGKTTISSFLADPANPRYGKCDIDWVDLDNKPQVLVYNHDFVKRNFVETHLQKGIFTLDQDNTEALNAIKTAEDEIQNVETQKQPVSASLKTLQEESERATNQLKDGIWKHKERFERTALENCMNGFMGSKDRFLEKVMGASASALAKEDIPPRFTKIQEEMVALKSAGLQRKSSYSPLQSDADSTEGNTIFQEKIVGSTDSYMADIIAHLNHDSWVNEGIEHYLDKTDDCPFCKQHIDEDLKDRIRAHLDTAYKTKVAALKRHQAAYQGQISTINTWVSQCREDEDLMKDANLVHQLDTLQRVLEANLAHINSKVKDSSAVVTLESTTPFIQTINDTIITKNTEIAEFNIKVDNKAASIQAIKDEFWHLVRKDCEEVIQVHIQAEEARNVKRKEIQDELNSLTVKVTALRKTIEENQGKTKNVDEAIAWINSQLAHLGLEGFSIQKLTKDNLTFYQIKRPNQTGEGVFDTLSEGEKTLISFLYFLKLCRGSDDMKGGGSLDNRMVVIDDPISSLSFNLVFDVSCLIWRIFMSPESKYKQVIVLTHHLYFLHEMFSHIEKTPGKKLGKEYALFRLVKNQRTQVEAMKRGSVLNPYQAYWRTLKDIQSGAVSHVVLPNTMRNILEHYFAFVHARPRLNKAFEDLKSKYPDTSFAAFERYVHRGSHSDSVNITDMREIDMGRYMVYFKEVFVSSGFESHYESMMTEEGAVVALSGVQEAA
jgi:wobble nucleotide-excising tRNase